MDIPTRDAWKKQETGTIDEEKLLAYGGVYMPYPKGAVVFAEGAHCRFYHQLVTGSVRWVNVSEDGRELIQSFIAPGECFGELPLFDDQPYAASAIANVDSLVIRLRKESFLQLIKTDFEVHFAVSKLLASRLRSKFFFVRSIAHPSPEVRISELFTWLKQQNKLIDSDNCVNLTRQQIADLSGLRVETVIRAIKRMQQENLLEIRDRKIYFKGGKDS